MKAVAKYWSVFSTQILNDFAYLGELVGRSITILIFLWIFIQLWQVTYAAVGSQSIAGLSLSSTIWYFLLAESITLSKPRLSQAIAESVKDGSIAYLLNKPYNFLLYHLSISLADSLMRGILNVVAGSILVSMLIGPHPDPLGWIIVIPAVIFAWLIDFCISALIGLLAFVTEEINAFEWIYNKFLLVLGGVLIPLDFYPDWLQHLTQLLPFSYSVYAPSRLFVEPSLERLLTILPAQLFWIAVLGLMLFTLYRRAEKWLSINGG